MAIDIEKLKSELLQAKQDLEERLEKIKNHIRHVDTKIEPDFAEQATQREDDEVLNELSDSLQRNLAEIRLALMRIEEGNYGVCTGCGKSISVERLAAIPYTNYCKDCIRNISESTSRQNL